MPLEALLERLTPPKKKRKPQSRMHPDRKRLSTRKLCVVFDVETKKAEYGDLEDRQEAGFERCFLTQVFDGSTLLKLRNEAYLKGRPWQTRAILPGGCIDKLMAVLLVPEYSRKYARIYSHNGGRFDQLFVLGWLHEHADEYAFEIVSVGSRIQRLDIWRHDTDRKKLSWSFVDSLAIIPLSLKEAGKTFCKDEAKVEFDLNTHEDDPRWEVYGGQDVRTLFYALQEFHRLVEGLGGEVGLTAPSTALKLFKRRYLLDTVERHAHFADCKGKCEDMFCERQLYSLCDGTCHGCLHSWIFEAYVGGRSEVFERYGTDLHYFDLNSSYPRSMMEPMPVGKKKEISHPSLEQCTAMIDKGYVGFLECDVFIPDTCNYPPLPTKRDNKLVFDTGYLSGIWDFEELRLLSEPEVNGTILYVRKAVFYESRPIFANMVTDIYSYRDTRSHLYNEGLSFVAKLILNSLYGKFGMASLRESVSYVPRGAGHEPEGSTAMVNYSLPGATDSVSNCVLWKTPNFVDVDYMIPQIAAHITALSRIRLYRGILFALRRGLTPKYGDTDSLCVDGMLPTGTRLGEWKEEYTGYHTDECLDRGQAIQAHDRKKTEEEGDIIGGMDYRPKRPLFGWLSKRCPGCISSKLSADNVLPKLYRLDLHYVDCESETCQGCLMRFHLPTCKDKKKGCRGCASSLIRMKGIGNKAQSPDNFDRLVYDGEAIPLERILQHRGILASWLPNHKGQVEYGPKTVKLEKKHRAVFDKRVMDPDTGLSRPFHRDKMTN